MSRRRRRGEPAIKLFVVLLLGLMLPVTDTGSAGAQKPEPDDRISSLYAIREPNLFRHNVGLLELAITNVGTIGYGRWPRIGQTSASWRGGEYLYVAALWIGAVASDNLAYVSTGQYEMELLPAVDPVYTIYENFEGCPGGNRPGFSPNRGDDDDDGLIDEDWPNGLDDDEDGLIDEDFSGISQQMFTCEYWDYTEEAQNLYPAHRPLNVRVRQSSYAWATEGSNEFIGFDFQVINDGFEVLRNVYLGFFVDGDVGPPEYSRFYTDDQGAYALIDTIYDDQSTSYRCDQRIPDEEGQTVEKRCWERELRIEMCYMWDTPDDGEGNTGYSEGYFGTMFLGHTTDPSGEAAPSRAQMHTAAFFSGSGAYPEGDPQNDTERYDLLSSGNKPQRAYTQPADYRYVISAGPFRDLRPGESLDLQVAFVVGHGRGGLVENAITAQVIYDGKWRTVDEDWRTGREGRETCLVAEVGETLTWEDPCDTLNPLREVRIVRDTECLPHNYVDDDCDCCTPLFSSVAEHDAETLGLETLVNWVGTVAPPSPNTNLRPGSVSVTAPAGDRKVYIEWDNSSELVADPIQRRILFEGYRIWRVEGWKRPQGAAGPAPRDWQLWADISRRPPDVRPGGDYESSDWHISRFVNSAIDSTSPGAERIVTGAGGADSLLWSYPIGRYGYVDSLGLKNGMLYFYDVTAYSAWMEEVVGEGDTTYVRRELAGRPSAREADGVRPVWEANERSDISDVHVVPNPFKGDASWGLEPSSTDPTGTFVAFKAMPPRACEIDIYTLAGDLVRSLNNHEGGSYSGTVRWDLLTRNGQDVVSGVYLYHVKCGTSSTVGRFVIIR